MTATGGQEVNASFTLNVSGMCCTTDVCMISEQVMNCALHSYPLNHVGGCVVHSFGRLIPHEFPITDLQQISGPDGIGRITCTVSSGTAMFLANGVQLETGGVTQTKHGVRATLVVNPTNVSSFQNKGLYCTGTRKFFYLFLSNES